MERRAALKSYMKRTNQNEVDIASRLKVDPITIRRFLEGNNIRRITEYGIDQLLAGVPAQQQDPEDPPPTPTRRAA